MPFPTDEAGVQNMVASSAWGNHNGRQLAETWTSSMPAVADSNNNRHGGLPGQPVMRVLCTVAGRTESVSVVDDYKPVSWLLDAFGQRFGEPIGKVLLGGKALSERTMIREVLRDGDLLQGEPGRPAQQRGDALRTVSIRERYREIKRFKGGAMGTVFKAQDTASTGIYREVVVKLLQAGASVERQERFKREARIVAGLNHPNIITYLDMGNEPDGTLFLVMECMDGPDLQQILDKRRYLNEEDTVSVAMGVLNALCCSHANGVVHRDLKPANIMVILHTMTVKVIDFGLARELRGGSLLTGENVVGTPMYFAPEQTISGAEISTVTDIWAVGVLIFHCITGRVPFAKLGDPLQVIVNEICTRPVPDITAASEGRASERLREVVEAALQKRVQRRIPSAEAMLGLVRAVAQDHQTLRSQSVTKVMSPDSEVIAGRPSAASGGAAVVRERGGEGVEEEVRKLRKINEDYHASIVKMQREVREQAEQAARSQRKAEELGKQLDQERRAGGGGGGGGATEEALAKERRRNAALQVEAQEAQSVLRDRTETLEGEVRQAKEEARKRSVEESVLQQRVEEARREAAEWKRRLEEERGREGGRARAGLTELRQREAEVQELKNREAESEGKRMAAEERAKGAEGRAEEADGRRREAERKLREKEREVEEKSASVRWLEERVQSLSAGEEGGKRKLEEELMRASSESRGWEERAMKAEAEVEAMRREGRDLAARVEALGDRLRVSERERREAKERELGLEAELATAESRSREQLEAFREVESAVLAVKSENDALLAEREQAVAAEGRAREAEGRLAEEVARGAGRLALIEELQQQLAEAQHSPQLRERVLAQGEELARAVEDAMRVRGELEAEKAAGARLREQLERSAGRAEDGERAVQVMVREKQLLVEQAQELSRQRKRTGQRAAIALLSRVAAALDRDLLRTALHAFTTPRSADVPSPRQRPPPVATQSGVRSSSEGSYESSDGEDGAGTAEAIARIEQELQALRSKQQRKLHPRPSSVDPRSLRKSRSNNNIDVGLLSARDRRPRSQAIVRPSWPLSPSPKHSNARVLNGFGGDGPGNMKAKGSNGVSVLEGGADAGRWGEGARRGALDGKVEEQVRRLVRLGRSTPQILGHYAVEPYHLSAATVEEIRAEMNGSGGTGGGWSAALPSRSQSRGKERSVLEEVRAESDESGEEEEALDRRFAASRIRGSSPLAAATRRLNPSSPAPPTKGQRQVARVRVPEECAKVEEAVRRCVEGGTVLLGRGRHVIEGELDLDVGINLEGEDGAVVVGRLWLGGPASQGRLRGVRWESGSGSCLTFGGGRWEVEDCAAVGGEGCVAVTVRKEAHVTMSRCVIAGQGQGGGFGRAGGRVRVCVAASDIGEVQLRECRLEGATEAGLQAAGGSHCSVIDCSFSQIDRAGIFLRDEAVVTATQCAFGDVAAAFEADATGPSSLLRLENNRVDSAVWASDARPRKIVDRA